MAKSDDLETEWTGHDLFDIDGDKIGPIVDIHYGEFAGNLKWLIVESGLLGTRTVFVPAGEVRSSGGRLVAPYPKDWLKKAPKVEYESARRETDERNLCAFYGLGFVRSTSEAEPVEGCVDGEQQPPAT